MPGGTNYFFLFNHSEIRVALIFLKIHCKPQVLIIFQKPSLRKLYAKEFCISEWPGIGLPVLLENQCTVLSPSLLYWGGGSCLQANNILLGESCHICNKKKKWMLLLWQ